jgi:hypothetical protein
VPEFGFRYEVGVEPIAVDVGRMVRAYQQGVREFASLYAGFIAEGTRRDLAGLAGVQPDAFTMPTEVWARTVYAFALAYHRRRLNPGHLLSSLTPLYLGRTASWVNEAKAYDADAVEAALDAVCERFESLKPQLADAWREGRTLS